MEELGLVGDLAVVGGAALAGGILARLLRLPVVLGYIGAGLAISPNTPGVVGDLEDVRRVADLGVALLMFTIGIRFSLRELRQTRELALFGGIGQVLAVLVGGFLLGSAIGLSPEASIMIGAVAAISSTMIALRLLEQAGEIGGPAGRVAISFSLAQDLAAVPLIVMIPVLAGGEENPLPAFGLAAGKGVALVAGVWIVGTLAVPRLLDRISMWRSRELFLLTIIVLALGTASISAVAGLSIAFGAFLAGLLISESEYAHRTLAEVFPLREVFAVVFFVAVGMLINPDSFAEDPEIVFGLAALAILAKLILITAAARTFGYSSRASTAAALALANMGEFSFVIASEALDEGVFDARVNEAVLSAVLISIAASPFLFYARERLAAMIRRLPGASALLADRYQQFIEEPARLVNHAIICGFDEAGQEVARALANRQFRYLVIEEDPVAIRALRADGIPCILGDAALPIVLEQAQPQSARALVVTLSDAARGEAVVAAAKEINPRLDVIARGGDWASHLRLQNVGASAVVHGEFEAGLEFVRHTLHRFGVTSQEIQAVLSRRRRDYAAR